MSPPKRSDRLWGPPSFQFCSYRGNLSPGTKMPGLEADHPYPSRADIENMWSYTSTPSWSAQGQFYPLPQDFGILFTALTETRLQE
jgi:hypothetical protein